MTTKRQVFYSFHYQPDHWRASQVRNIGTVEGNKPAADNDWEQVKKGGDSVIKRWIDEQMKYKSCTVVLVGEETAGREWVNYEIIESWKKSMGVVGIYIHGLKNQDGFASRKGRNPFDCLKYDKGEFSRIARCYDPQGNNSKERYAWISEHLSNAVEEAICIRNRCG